MFIIVPEAMEHAIKRDLDRVRDTLPENERGVFDAERDIHRQAIINFYGEHGYYPQVGGVERTKELPNDQR